MNRYEFYDNIKNYIDNTEIIDNIPKSIDLNILWDYIKIKIEQHVNMKILNIEIDYSGVIMEFFKYEENNSYKVNMDSGIYRKSLYLTLECNGEIIKYKCVYPNMIEIPEIVLSEDELKVIEDFKETTWLGDKIKNKIKHLIYNNFKLGYTWKLIEIKYDPNRMLLSAPPQKCYNAIFMNNNNETISLQLV